MEIKTKSFRENIKLLQNCIDKSNQFYSSFYLNFDDGYAYFFSDKRNGRLKFEFDGETTTNSFFVDAVKFLLLCNQYETLTIEADKTITYITEKGKKETFKLTTFEEENIDLKTFSTDGAKDTYVITNKTTALLKKAINYMPVDEMSQLHGVFFRNGSLLSSDRATFFETESIEVSNADLSGDVVKVLMYIDEQSSLSVFDTYTQISTDEVDVIVPNNKNLFLGAADGNPLNPKDDWFVSAYDHKTNFIVQKDEFLKNIAFLDSFLVDIVNTRAYLTLQDGDLVIKVKDKNTVEKVCSVVSYSPELEGFEFCVNQQLVKKIMGTLGGGDILCQIAADKFAVNFVTIEDTKTHCVLRLLENS